jgi:outer membrane protein assembly factor BamB
MSRCALGALALAIVSVPLATHRVGPQGPEQWNQFRGPGSRGIAVGDRPLPAEFGPTSHLLWKRAVSPGHSSPCVFGERIFLTGCDGEQLETLCLDRSGGEVLWRRTIPLEEPESVHPTNSLASPTPAADGERVYAYFGSFGLLCYDFDGEEAWRRPLPRAKNLFGTASSPMLAGDWLILARDTQDESWVEAIERASGATVWRIDRTGFPSGWSTPVLWRSDDVDELLVYGAFRLTAYDLRDGTERWSVPGLADEPCITPVTGEGLVFVTSYNMRTNPEVIGLPAFAKLLEQYDGDRNGQLSRAEVEPNESILSRADADGEGDHPLRGFFRFLDRDRDGQLTEVEWQRMFEWLGTFQHENALVAIRPGDAERPAAIAWQHARGVPECPSPLYHDGLVYMVTNGGLVSCLDARTGQLKYHERLGSRGPCYASPVVGDGKVFTASARGVVTVFAAGGELRVLARNDLGERIMATPALVDGRIYVRTEKHLFAFGADH